MKRILIIEDDIAIAEIEKDYLDISGFSADIEDNGESGLQRALQGNYDLILLDLMLPGLDGFSVCTQLRERLNIPIVMVSAKKEDVDKIRGLGIGADDYIVKPFSPNELVARVKSHLARYERLTTTGSDNWESGHIKVGELCVHPGPRRVFVDDREVKLKNKEFELLFFLMTNADIVYSKEALYQQVWGMDSVGDSATVTVHINRLREKVEREPSKPRHIITVWGVGYRFKA